ncbi:hypothetical protein EDE12_11210 [Methylosinus sp. sav-2]|uniref:hypothetical protein n=1 Tax=Methylosinus sp. sav-2 TaxID=2485168 RepID=UPI0004794E1E|nr:hypothetical protein [Methylosinus sp. sav-2]TDX61909.1 hypothetical protein EDE12_11210 [Methylosinus sp. sav-2]
MPFLALLLPAARAALGLVVSAVRTPIGAAALAFGLAWLIAGRREHAACEARLETFRVELQRAADAEHARRESVIAEARAAGRVESEALARKNLDLEIRLKESADASAAHDRRPCLDAAGVMRLDRLAR